jgi:hypothetical protein
MKIMVGGLIHLFIEYRLAEMAAPENRRKLFPQNLPFLILCLLTAS